MTEDRKPSRDEVARAAGRTIADVLAEDLRVLFCGINPGLYSGAVGHHFARPGNRFWKALHLSGFTDRLLSPSEERGLLRYGIGLTNIVRRATASSGELSPEDLRAGADTLTRKVRRTRPRFVAILGVSAYRAAFEDRGALLGPQPECLAGAGLWVLPNPSGRNAHHRLVDLAERFADLRAQVEA